MDASTPIPEGKPDQRLPVAEKKERRAREMEWENEGGRVRNDEKTRAGGNLKS